MERDKIERTIARQIKTAKKATRSSPRKKSVVANSSNATCNSDPVPGKDQLSLPRATDKQDHPTLVQSKEQNSKVSTLTKKDSPCKPLAPKNAFDVLKSAKSDAKPIKKTKKLTKKVQKKKVLDQSSLYEPKETQHERKVLSCCHDYTKTHTTANTCRHSSQRKLLLFYLQNSYPVSCT